MAKEKYYTTLIILYIPNDIIDKYKAKNNHKQLKIVAKAKSRAAAERLVQEILGVTYKIFRPDFTYETGNVSAIQAGDKFGVAIALDTLAREYFDLPVIQQEVNEYQKH